MDIQKVDHTILIQIAEKRVRNNNISLVFEQRVSKSTGMGLNIGNVDKISPISTISRVIAFAAFEHVYPRTTTDDVIPSVTKDDVIPIATLNNITPSTTSYSCEFLVVWIRQYLNKRTDVEKIHRAVSIDVCFRYEVASRQSINEWTDVSEIDNSILIDVPQ